MLRNLKKYENTFCHHRLALQTQNTKQTNVIVYYIMSLYTIYYMYEDSGIIRKQYDNTFNNKNCSRFFLIRLRKSQTG